MSAVERTVHFAHALQHHDPLADPTRVSEDSNCLGQRRWSCKQTHAGDEGTSRALEVVRAPPGAQHSASSRAITARQLQALVRWPRLQGFWNSLTRNTQSGRLDRAVPPGHTMKSQTRS